LGHHLGAGGAVYLLAQRTDLLLKIAFGFQFTQNLAGEFRTPSSPELFAPFASAALCE